MAAARNIRTSQVERGSVLQWLLIGLDMPSGAATEFCCFVSVYPFIHLTLHRHREIPKNIFWPTIKFIIFII